LQADCVLLILPSGTAGGVEETRKCPTITNGLDGVHAMQCIHSFTFLLRPLNSGVPCTALDQRMKIENKRVKASGRDLSSSWSWSRFKYKVSTPHPVGCSNWPETLESWRSQVHNTAAVAHQLALHWPSPVVYIYLRNVVIIIYCAQACSLIDSVDRGRRLPYRVKYRKSGTELNSNAFLHAS